jgi:hypothetical protein
LTNGQVLIGSTGVDPVAAALTPGTNIQISNGTGSITIAANIITRTAVSSSPYVVLSTDYFLSVNTATAITVQLPNAPTTGRTFAIKDSTGNSTVNNITVTTVGGTVLIDGATNYLINNNYSSIQTIFNGTSYEVF